MMLSFVIHSKPVLACYSSPDRFPLLNPLLFVWKGKSSHMNLTPSLRGVLTSVWFYFYSDSNNTSCRKEHHWEPSWKAKTCLKLSQWCVFQRFSRAAGISLFRQIAVQVHQWNVDRAGSEPENSRLTAVIKGNSLCSHSSAEGMIMWPVQTCRWKKAKRVNTVSKTLEINSWSSALFIHVSTSTVLIFYFIFLCIMSFNHCVKIRATLSEIHTSVIVLFDFLFIQEAKWRFAAILMYYCAPFG